MDRVEEILFNAGEPHVTEEDEAAIARCELRVAEMEKEMPPLPELPDVDLEFAFQQYLPDDNAPLPPPIMEPMFCSEDVLNETPYPHLIAKERAERAAAAVAASGGV